MRRRTLRAALVSEAKTSAKPGRFVWLDTTDRSLASATREHGVLRVVSRFSLETDAMMICNAVYRGKKQRSLLTLPRRKGESPGLAHRQRPCGLKEIPARYFEQDRMKHAWATAYPKTPHTHHAL